MSNDKPSSHDRRAFFGAAAAAGGLALATVARIPEAKASGSSSIVTVGLGGDYADLGSALAAITDNSAVNGYVVRLLPGVHALPPGGLALKPYVNIEGSGQNVTEIACIDNDVLTAASCCKVSNLTLSGDFDAVSSTSGIILEPAATVTDFKLEGVDMFVTGGYGAAVRLKTGYATTFFNNVNVYTTSIGFDLRGYAYLDGVRMFLSGNATGTPYYGIYVSGAARVYIWGSKIGTGYGRTSRAGFGDSLEVKNDALSDVIAVYIPAAAAVADPRVECHDLNSYARNELTTSTAVKIACMRAEAGRIRIYGGMQQAETPANNLVRQSLSQAPGGTIEAFSSRFSATGGAIWGTNTTPSWNATVADNNLKMTEDTGGICYCDASGGPFVLKLPGWYPGFRNGVRFIFIKTDTSANAVTIAGTATMPINGATSKKLTTAYQKIELVATANAWYLM